ncbi:hypothetical protein [Streptomyces sp. SID9727]|uniref:hypothetical protein n=1 Tax=Streptomyces sp. SID9727 TaxID=2706114 RepID=UPI0013C9EC8A|nr:hypothetical protein [Streptomyces sp. SID9727]NEC67735.1 hypothetical protein [Streptomyces sp. SID9727]
MIDLNSGGTIVRIFFGTAASGAACIALAVTLSGCSGNTEPQEQSAGQMLAEANKTMKSLQAVTITGRMTMEDGRWSTTRLRTDLKGTCSFTTAASTGERLDQIRIGDTDFIRPNLKHMQLSGMDTKGRKDQKSWGRTTVDPAASAGENGLTDCTHPFASFGKVVKGETGKTRGVSTIGLIVTDRTDKSGAYTFHIATEGKPYIYEVVYKSPDFRNVTSFSDFNTPLNVKPPKAHVVKLPD